VYVILYNLVVYAKVITFDFFSGGGVLVYHLIFILSLLVIQILCFTQYIFDPTTEIPDTRKFKFWDNDLYNIQMEIPTMAGNK